MPDLAVALAAATRNEASKKRMRDAYGHRNDPCVREWRQSGAPYEN